jgi:hypothetical protein
MPVNLVMLALFLKIMQRELSMWATIGDEKGLLDERVPEFEVESQPNRDPDSVDEVVFGAWEKL